jgi:hypothetical protein
VCLMALFSTLPLNTPCSKGETMKKGCYIGVLN